MMKSELFKEGKRIRKLERKALARYDELGLEDEVKAQLLHNLIEREQEEFIKYCEYGAELHNKYMERFGGTDENWFFITVRPKPEVEFTDFYKKVCKYVERRIMITYKLTFEQKDPEGSGEGFHIHIVANTTHRSKGECLRDTISTFKDVAAFNCIKVLTTRTPDKIVNDYMLEYKSNDNHKITTKAGDEVWRERMGLLALYSHQTPPPTVLSSTGRTVEVISEPIITEIHMNAEDTQTFTNATPIVKRLPLQEKSLK